MHGPSTAVIGAGISGLTSGKMLGDYGIDYTCFETSDRIGGNWAFGNPNGHSSAYRSLHIDTSKHRLSFKDFPMPEDYPDFPHHTQIKQYLEDYAEAFDLKTQHRVRERCRARSPSRRAADGSSTCRTARTREFDLLVVANGHHWDPRFAEFPGEFTGESIHSHHYIDPTDPLDLKGKRILVVGIGNSAADISVELSSKALQNEVTLSTRSSAWIVPKYIYGLPADKYYATTPYLPLKWQRRMIQKMQFMTGSNPELYGLPGAQPQVLRGPPDPVGRAAAAARLGRHHAQAERLPARRRDRPLRGRHQRRLRRDRLRHRLQHHLPVLRRGVHLRAEQPDPAVQADVQARPRGPRLHGASRRRRRPSSPSSRARPGCWRRTPRGTTGCPTSRRWSA